MVDLEKPPHGDPCNGCGWCCRNQLCPLASGVFGGSQNRQCPALEEAEGRAVCGLVAHPMAYRMVATLKHGVAAMGGAALTLIGSGVGCDALAYGEEPSEALRERSRLEFHKRRPLVRAALRMWGVEHVVKAGPDPRF
jgi:hypothetical protein